MRLFGIPLLLPALCLLLGLSSCAGYRLGTLKPSSMERVKSLAVPAFKNQTLEPHVEVLLASTLIKQLQQDGTYRIADEKDADAVVEGSLERITRNPARGVRNDFYQTSEYTLDLVLRIRVVERASGVVLSEREVHGNSSFFVSGSSRSGSPRDTEINARIANVNRDERQAIPLAAEDAAIRLTSYLTEGW